MRMRGRLRFIIYLRRCSIFHDGKLPELQQALWDDVLAGATRSGEWSLVYLEVGVWGCAVIYCGYLLGASFIAGRRLLDPILFVYYVAFWAILRWEGPRFYESVSGRFSARFL